MVCPKCGWTSNVPRDRPLRSWTVCQMCEAWMTDWPHIHQISALDFDEGCG